MRALLLVASLGVGCIDGDAPMTEPDGADVQELVADASGCHATPTLVGNGDAQDVDLGPYMFGAGRFCLRLDATLNLYGHLMASTDQFPGVDSPLGVRLERPDGTLLSRGGDVTYGVQDPRVSTVVELSIDGGTIQDVVLIVEADGIESGVSVSLFERLE